MRRNQPRPNLFWIIGRVAVIDISTPSQPRATALLDVADVPTILDGRGRWSACKVPHSYTAYASRRYVKVDGRRGTQMLHRLLGVAGPDQVVDHRNGDGLDNRRKNLRGGTRSQNQGNRRLRSRAGLFKGVSFQKRYGNWVAQIHQKGRHIHLGTFLTPEDAARAYDTAAIAQFGEFALTNFGRQSA